MKHGKWTQFAVGYMDRARVRWSGHRWCKIGGKEIIDGEDDYRAVVEYWRGGDVEAVDGDLRVVGGRSANVEGSGGGEIGDFGA